ncbi:YfjI family protein [Aliiroseovarius sp. F20344]|uniref:YfjI family protein n=1 Tax=Aliiroseovarius sp. F20344 TaxID=2926414 RepID=UPI001FF1949D|nr:YfjI family protein [Aliiroseovarius sp. F20344]MCK0142995.1 YfjI family protein [Aliiroseovarius sp. F20344]
MQASKSSKWESYAFKQNGEAPTPLFGELRDAEPIPSHALGPFANPVQAISTLTQAPDAIAMQSILTVASVATQAIADVESLQGVVPLSCFFLTVAQSGERKSACDSLATSEIDRIDKERVRVFHREIREHEAEKLEFQKRRRRSTPSDFDVIETDHDKERADLPPEPPLFPAIRISDPTIEGLFRQLENGTPSVAVMTDEGGQFFGGHSMKRENALKTAAGFSKLWDGAPLSRSRASAEPVWLCGKRVSLHLMIQPGVAQHVVGDPTMKDQGLLSRVLIAWPNSKIGSRIICKDTAQREQQDQAQRHLERFNTRVGGLLQLEMPLHLGTRSELNPKHLKLSGEARVALEVFYNRVERASGAGGAFEYLSGFAAKVPEMAARLAGIQSVFADEEADEVSLRVMENGIAIMEWYLSEMLRITDTGRPDQNLCDAETIRCWLEGNWAEEFIDKRTLMKKGPGHLRDGNTLSQCIQKLEAHGWLVRGSGTQVIDGANSKTFWHVVRRAGAK